MFVIFLNGPPRSGKDTIATYLSFKYGIKHYTFKNELESITRNFFSIPKKEWEKMYENKGEKNEALCINGNLLTPREALIHVAENVLKPVLGNNIFSKSLYKRIKNEERVYTEEGRCKEGDKNLNKGGYNNKGGDNNNNNKHIVCISDLGFMEEINMFRSHKIKYCIIRLHRTGCDFSIDSRNYIKPVSYEKLYDYVGPDDCIDIVPDNYDYDIYNNWERKELYEKIDSILLDIMERE